MLQFKIEKGDSSLVLFFQCFLRFLKDKFWSNTKVKFPVCQENFMSGIHKLTLHLIWFSFNYFVFWNSSLYWSLTKWSFASHFHPLSLCLIIIMTSITILLVFSYNVLSVTPITFTLPFKIQKENNYVPV